MCVVRMFVRYLQCGSGVNDTVAAFIERKGTSPQIKSARFKNELTSMRPSLLNSGREKSRHRLYNPRRPHSSMYIRQRIRISRKRMSSRYTSISTLALTRNRDCGERVRVHLTPPRLFFEETTNLPEFVYCGLIELLKHLVHDPGQSHVLV